MKTRYILYIFLLLQGSLMSATIKHININNVDIPVIFEEKIASNFKFTTNF